MNSILAKVPKAMRQSMIYAIALAGSKAISLMLVPVFTHYLEPADYGRLDILQTLADVLSIIIGLGLAETAFRFCDKNNFNENAAIIANLYGLSWIIAVVSMLATQLLAPTISTLLPGEITELQTRLILASLSLSGTILLPMAWLRINGKAKLYLYGSLGRTVLQALLACVFLFSGFGVTGFVFAGFIACVCLSVWMAIIQMRETGVSFSLGLIKKYSVYGCPLIFTGFAGFILGSFDRWILAETTGSAIMAEYALAAKFGLITAVLIQPFDMWWHAKRFSTFRNEGNGKCASVAMIGFVVVCAAVLIVCSVSPLLITLLTPPSYHGAIKYVPWLVVLAAIHNLTQTLGFGIYLQTNTKYPAIIDGVAAVIALIAYFILIPLYQIEGAIMATAIALTSRFFVTLFTAQSLNYIPYDYRKFLCMGLYIAVGSFWVSYATSNIDQIIAGTIALLGLCGIAMVLNILPYPKFWSDVKT